jgi:hypothetical protein
MEPDKFEAVYNFPRPKSVTEVRGFLGLVGYYRSFINQLATLATPLTDLTEKHTKFSLDPSSPVSIRAN